MCRCDDEGVDVPLLLKASPKGGYAVTSPVLPELLSHGNTPEQALANARTDHVSVDIDAETGEVLNTSIM